MGNRSADHLPDAQRLAGIHDLLQREAEISSGAGVAELALDGDHILAVAFRGEAFVVTEIERAVREHTAPGGIEDAQTNPVTRLERIEEEALSGICRETVEARFGQWCNEHSLVSCRREIGHDRATGLVHAPVANQACFASLQQHVAIRRDPLCTARSIPDADFVDQPNETLLSAFQVADPERTIARCGAAHLHALA